ncbi:MAG: NAD(P)/FAD-dependent oxidoreductase [Eubacteriales bacterium]|nr:NAD(P)/FAD-dependent oxidoreductase [Eubacteriales bacterium]
MQELHDLIVIGAGPAGVSAAVYAKSRGLNVLILEAEAVGGLIGKVSKVSHFASAIVDETGPEFAQRLQAQIDAAGIKLLYERVTAVKKIPEGYLVLSEQNEHRAAKLIIASGAHPKELPLELPEAVEIQHWALGQEAAVKDKLVVVNGGSDGAAKEALYLARFAREIHLVQDQAELMCIAEFKAELLANPKIQIHCGSTLAEIKADGSKITSVRLQGKDSSTITDPAGILVFAQIGLAGNSDFLEGFLNLENSFVPTEAGKNELPEGLWLAGDIKVKTVRQVATAVADGCLAGIAAAR